jgi:aspartyl-tRNA(Asn)/glutamyl-tRNA(Gln) amidotransferase subunit C
MQDGDLEAINEALAVMDRIHEVPLDRGDFPGDCGEAASLREDAPRPSMSADELLRNAPQVEAGCISVPKILGGDGS